jgi:hypothetical protein
MLEGSDLLEFANIPRVRFPVYPVAQHLAEKLHAYTLPRDQVNTRVKDLVDMVAIAAIDRVQADALAASIEASFSARDPRRVAGSARVVAAAVRAPCRRVANSADHGPRRGHDAGARILEPATARRSSRSGLGPDRARLALKLPSRVRRRAGAAPRALGIRALAGAHELRLCLGEIGSAVGESAHGRRHSHGTGLASRAAGLATAPCDRRGHPRRTRTSERASRSAFVDICQGGSNNETTAGSGSVWIRRHIPAAPTRQPRLTDLSIHLGGIQ